MPPAAESPRSRADACPGALSTHEAADGHLARVRVPGGAVTAAQLRVLADAAEHLGDGELHLTSRANLQLRGLGSGSVLAERLAAAGLLPSPTHERVRNIVASPLSGLGGGLADVRPLVAALDAAVCAAAPLAGLPGRFLFGLDDGRGDIVDDRIDVCWRAVEAGTGALLLAGEDTGLRVAISDAVAVLVTAALAFAELRGDDAGAAWQVRELGEARAGLIASVRARAGLRQVAPRTWPAGRRPRVGDRADAAVVAGLALGVVTAAQARALASLAGSVVFTPWRSVVVPEADERVRRALTSAGLLLDPAAAELAITACIGAPACAKSLADVRADVMEAIRAPVEGTAAGDHPAHFSGCGRRCGRPRTGHLDLVAAEGGGYLVDGTAWVSSDQLASTLLAESVLVLPGEKGTDSRDRLHP